MTERTTRRDFLGRVGAMAAGLVFGEVRQPSLRHRMKVEGDPEFVRGVRAALDRIGAGWDDYVARSLMSIRQDRSQPWLAGVQFVAYGNWKLGVAVFREIPQGVSSGWLPAAIVHEAAHAQAYYAGLRYYGACGEFYADAVSRAFWRGWPVRHPVDIPEVGPLSGNPEVPERGSIRV